MRVDSLANVRPIRPEAASPVERRGRGRPPKRDPKIKTYGSTLRLTDELRDGMRRWAESETKLRGKVVPVHDLLIELIIAELRVRGYPL